MSGKSYTMKEMKTIVDYLVDHKLYGEIKGRKMWMDFANSQLTNRTWQSLKETFLKRVLPDIHNPYYKLTIEQINSFRAGYDVIDKINNKLEIHTISDDSNSNEKNQNDNEQLNIGNGNEGETTAGENVKSSKIPPRSRSSADTVILDNCYETAEEIQKDLESIGDTENNEKPMSKSLRDCITYSEPLTPMQEVLDDFASEPEDSDRESRMQIVENVPENENSEDNDQITEMRKETPTSKSVATDVAKNAKGLSAEVVEEVLAQELDGGSKPEHKSPRKVQSSTAQNMQIPLICLDSEISSVQAENGAEKIDDTNAKSSGTITIVTAKNVKNTILHNSNQTEMAAPNDSNPEPISLSGGLNISNSTVDASLPNNPEAFKNKLSKVIEDKNIKTPLNIEEVPMETKNKTTRNALKAKGRKRSYSADTLTNIEIKKKKLEKQLTPSLKIDNKPADDTVSVIKTDNRNGNIEVKSANNKDNIISDKNSNNSGMIKKLQVEKHKHTSVHEVPSTSFASHVENKILSPSEPVKDSKTIESAEIKNPCLENVSLFDEQFNKTKYNMSESSDTEQNKKETKVNKIQSGTVLPNAPLEVKSNTESDNEEILPPQKKRNRPGVLSSKSERDKAISNIFGFSGGVGSKRRRQLSRRSRTISHNNVTHSNAPVSNSSEWTSAGSDSETFVSPPRGRKNRPTKKFLKPQSAKILSLEEEGGLFVMYGKRIYPIVKDGKIVKNYLTYLPESDSEEGESYWKLKYVEEKKKAAELKKLLEETKDAPSREINSPILQAKPPIKPNTSHIQPPESSHDTGKQMCIPERDYVREEAKTNPPEKIMIKFTKNNEEVHLEGHWPQIHPVLEQVVHIFHKEVEPTVTETKSKRILEPPEQSKEISSGNSTPIINTPVDPEVREKVNKIESEIFKEIEERDKEEEDKPNGEVNVTKRYPGRPRKSSSLSLPPSSPAKRPKTSDQTDAKKPEGNISTSKENREIDTNVTDNKDDAPKRQTRVTRKTLNDSMDTTVSKPVKTRRSKQDLDTSNNDQNKDDEGVRYMFPPKNKRQTLKTSANKKTNQKSQKSSTKTPKIVPSPENFSLKSIDSTQGYQDSDVSPVKTELRKKKKLHMSSFMIKTRNSLRRSARRKSHPYLYCDAFNDSSNSSIDTSAQIVTQENSSLNNEAYRSESYQLLMQQPKNSCKQLEPIDETIPIDNETYYIKSQCGKSNVSIFQNETAAQMNNQFGQMISDVGSSSNVSLPMSPELSVVENMSISKEMLTSVLDDYPTLNEIQSNEVKESTMCNKYMISQVDVSVPLMQQDCELKSCNSATDVSRNPKNLDTLLSKIGTFNINDQVSETDTLDLKLHNLLLESAKKITKAENEHKNESMMEVDVTHHVEVTKKVKSKKRCSTPRKRKDLLKSLAPKVDPVVEEEHVESYSKSGRKSCPPTFQTFECEERSINEDINIANEKTKGKKKKDIIKVKILRPKNKKTQAKYIRKSAPDENRISICTDSGINNTNESGMFLPIGVDDSVDLIHNHSETCLLANECVGDSIEFVENSKSVITLGDSMQSGDNLWSSQSEYNDAEHISPDLFCNNAQDVKSFYNSKYNIANFDNHTPFFAQLNHIATHTDENNTENIENTSDSVYHSPLGTELSHNSLITEDLSDDPMQPAARPSKWYLLSEDETMNTNLVGQGSTMLSAGSLGSSLKQLFPIACAVPNLSTITEMSRENEDSPRPTSDIDGLTGDDFNSQSIFDSNFNL